MVSGVCISSIGIGLCVFTNMRHVFAYLASGALVHPLSDIHKGASLRCATCDMSVVLRQSKGIPGRRYVRPHFALKSAGSGGSACSGGGGQESEEHLTAKDILMHRLHDLRIGIPLCRHCEKVRVVSLQPVEYGARLERRVGGLGRLRFDVVVTEDGKDVGVIEVCHTHPTDRAKVEAVLARGLWYVEYKAADVMHCDEDTPDGRPMPLLSLAPREWITGATCSACVARFERQRREAEAHRERCRKREEEERVAAELVRRAKEMSDADVLLAVQSILDAWEMRLESRIEEYALLRALGRDHAGAPWTGSRVPYRRGFWKCTSGCGWFPPDDLHVVERDDGTMTYDDFDDYESYVPPEYQNDTIRLCGMCAVTCEMCAGPFPRDRAERYGLCLRCNVRCKKMRTVLKGLREDPSSVFTIGGMGFPDHEVAVVRRYVDLTRVPVAEPVVVVPSTLATVAGPCLNEKPSEAEVSVEACCSGVQNALVQSEPVNALQVLMQSEGRRDLVPVPTKSREKKRARDVSDGCGSQLLFSNEGVLVCINGKRLAGPIDDPVARLRP